MYTRADDRAGTGLGSWAHRRGLIIALFAAVFGHSIDAGARRGDDRPTNYVEPKKEPFRELETVLPPFPAEGNLVEFEVRKSDKNRYFLDRAALSIGTDGVIRYVAVVKSSSGVPNISYEGIRCDNSQFKVYAYGTRDGKWTDSFSSAWRDVFSEMRTFRATLLNDYFCYLSSVAGDEPGDILDTIKGEPVSRFKIKTR
jgi:hypothetical protein